MTTVERKSTRAGGERAARLVFCASAIGEIGVGAGALAFPQILVILLAAPLDSSGLLVARMLGSALLALGVTWWIVRNEPLHELSSRFVGGYLIYNIGMGLLFSARAIDAAEPTVPWVVAVVHLLAGVGFAGSMLVVQRRAGNGG